METIHDPKREVELILCECLNKEVKGLSFFPNKGDAERETPFGAVICENMNPLAGGGAPRGYLCNVKVVYVSHMDETTSQEHGVFISKIEDAISRFPQNDPQVLRYVPEQVLFGYTKSIQRIEAVEHHLKLLLSSQANLIIHDANPADLAFKIREAIHSSSFGSYPQFDKYKSLGDHYFFEVGDGVVECNYTATKVPDLYITEKRRVKIAGIFMEGMTTSSEDQSFGDIFNCKVGVTENC